MRRNSWDAGDSAHQVNSSCLSEGGDSLPRDAASGFQELPSKPADIFCRLQVSGHFRGDSLGKGEATAAEELSGVVWSGLSG